jgi:hypothetical protein
VDLTSIPSVLPITPLILPMQPIPTTARSQNFTTFDSHYVNPVVQNLTLSVNAQREQEPHTSISLRGNVIQEAIHDAEYQHAELPLYTALSTNSMPRAQRRKCRAGCWTQMLAGINLCTAGCNGSISRYGAIGSTVGGCLSVWGYQMRFEPNLPDTLWPTRTMEQRLLLTRLCRAF